MATAKEEREKLARGEGCLAKAADDEPVFIVRAQDVFFIPVVGGWIKLATSAHSPKADEARDLLAEAMAWQEANHQRLKVPD